jgi:hypothetical protein
MLNHPSSSLGSDRKMTASPPPRSRDTHTRTSRTTYSTFAEMSSDAPEMMTSGEDQTHPRSHQPIMSIPAQPANAQASSSSQSQDAAHASVLMPSESIPDDATHIRGPNFDNAVNLQELLESYEKIGFQATGMAKAIKIVEQMVSRAHVVSTIELNTLSLYARSDSPVQTQTNPSVSSSATPPTLSRPAYGRSSVSSPVTSS